MTLQAMSLDSGVFLFAIPTTELSMVNVFRLMVVARDTVMKSQDYRRLSVLLLHPVMTGCRIIIMTIWD